MLNALTPRVTENLKEILEKWRVNVHEINKENIADKFYNNRAGKFVKARAFDKDPTKRYVVLLLARLQQASAGAPGAPRGLIRPLRALKGLIRPTRAL